MPESSNRKRVLVTDPISEAGLELLRRAPGFEVAVRIGISRQELTEIIGQHHALVVRSGTKVTADVLAAPGDLRAIGRAGTGVDNIDIEAATRAGVVVMNTPGGNSVAAAEHTIALVFALARNIPQANASLRDGRWERKQFAGVELAGKTLGVVGLGRIGREVVARARGLRMEVLGCDPYVSEDAVARMGALYADFAELLARSDFVTLHVPVTEETRHMVDTSALERVKKGARLINCARGGLVDEAALHDALDSGRLGGAALDVFESEPPVDRRLVEHPRVVATPHLGASTKEAQTRVGTEIARKIHDFLVGGVALDAVNSPSVDRP